MEQIKQLKGTILTIFSLVAFGFFAYENSHSNLIPLLKGLGWID